MRIRTVGLFLLALSVVSLSACNSSKDETDSSSAAPPTYKPAPKAPEPTSKPANTQVVIKTNMGDMVVELDDDRTPVTVKNFLQYVDDKFYDGTIIHRIAKGNIHVVQGGGFSESLNEKPTRPPIINESKKGRSNIRGTIAMARTNAPNSATSQFYINLKDDSMLDKIGAGYCVFGRVIEGMDVADKIGALRTENRGGAFGEIPAESVVIESIRRK